MYNDTVSLGNGLTVQNQMFGVATNISGGLASGIMGCVRPQLSSIDTPSYKSVFAISFAFSSNETGPTFVDSLFTQGVIKEKVASLAFRPFDGKSIEANGEVTFGGTDSTKFEGDIKYAYVPH